MSFLHPADNHTLTSDQLTFQHDALVDRVLARLQFLGAEHAEARLVEEDNFEVYGTAMSLSLVRSVENSGIKLTALKAGKKAAATVNDLSPEGLEAAMVALIEAMEASEPDPANAFSALPEQAGKTLFIGPQPFGVGGMDALRSALTAHLADFLDTTASKLPNLMLSELGGQYNHHRILLKNTLGTHLRESRGSFSEFTLFNAVDETKSSSFNYVGSAPVHLQQPLAQDAYWWQTLERSTRELEPVAFKGTITGNVVLAPCCVAELLYYAQALALSDDAFIKGFSKWQGKLGEQVADAKLTWRAMPTHPAVGEGYGITADGFVAEDATFLEQGVLKSYALSLYGANKTGHPRSANQGNLFLVEPGEKPFDGMIAGIEKGVLVCRLSGGQPSPNGDFSGIAKNSFMIENGKITHAITEAMATFNLFAVLKDIADLSQEVHDSGSFLAPYLLSHQIAVTGA